MDNTEAKFILRAYRSNGADAADPAFAEALAQAAKDPALAKWLEDEQAFDRAITSKLQSAVPPLDLRNNILAGVKASQRLSRPWYGLRAVGLAASLMIGVGLAVLWPRMTVAAETEKIAAWVSQDTARSHPDFEGNAWPKPLRDIIYQSREPIASMKLPFTMEELRAAGCRCARFDEREIYEICFVRDGKVFHLYVISRGKHLPKQPRVFQKNGAYAAVWADGRYGYALTSDGGEAALRSVL
jgi:hypothetical protein